MLMDTPAVSMRELSCSVAQGVVQFLETILPFTSGRGHPELGFPYQG